MKVLFIVPPDSEIGFPIGVALVAAQARKEGHSVSTLDAAAYRLSPSAISEVLRRARFDVAAIGGVIHQYGRIEWIAREVRRVRPDAHLVVGGPAATAAYDIFLENNDLDAVFTGEAELSFSRYLNELENGGAPYRIPGVFRKLPTGEIRGNPHSIVKDLDSIPLPAWDLLPMEVYANPQTVYSIGQEFHISTSRGCTNNCAFCTNTKGREMRFHSVERTMEEIRFLHERYGVDSFRFVDNNFAADIGHADALCEAILAYGKPLVFGFALRADFKDFKLLEKMHRAGFRAVMIGIESASQKLLDTMNKGLDIRQGKEMVRRVQDMGFYVYASFIVGCQGETHETVRETYDFISELKMPMQCFSFLTAFPSTVFWEEALKKGLVKNKAEHLRSLDFNELVINFSELSDEELRRSMSLLLGKYREMHPTIRTSLDLKNEWYGRDIVERSAARSLLYHDYPAFLFFGTGNYGRHSDPAFDRAVRYDPDRVECRLTALSRSSFALALRGAEPTDHPFFEKLLNMKILTSFLAIRLETDGRKLESRALLDRLAELGVTEFAVELCAPERKCHEKHTGEKGSFDRTLRGLENLAASGVPFMASIPITLFNMNALKDFPRFLTGIGASVVQLKYQPHAAAEAPLEVFPDLESLGPVLRESLDRFIQAGLSIRVDGVPPCVLGRHGALYRSRTAPYAIETTIPPLRNPMHAGAVLQGPQCSGCSSNIVCLGIAPGVHALFGWSGLNPAGVETAGAPEGRRES